MNHSFRLTIAVCCHADTPYFEEMLDSFINANVAWPKTELLICDDGSPTGGDGDKARKLIGRTDLPFSVRVLRHDSPWQHAASNQHLREEAKGEYLLLFDSDDVFVPFDVTAELDFLDRHPEYCGSYGKKLCFDSEHGFTGLCHGGDYSAFEMLVCPPLTVNGMIVRVSDLREAWGFVLPDGSKRDLGNDICLWLGCAQKKAFHFSDHFRALYRVHSGQLTHDAEAEYRESYRMFRDFCYAHSADLREKLHSGQPLAVPAERRREMLILLGAEFADAPDHAYALQMLDMASRIAPEDYGIREMRLRILHQQKRYAEVFREAFLMYAEHPNSPYITLVACRQAMACAREIGSDPEPFQRICDAASQRHFQLTTEQQAILKRTCDMPGGFVFVARRRESEQIPRSFMECAMINQLSELKSVFSPDDRFELIFSHPLFFPGGASDFLYDLCAKKKQDGISFLVVTYHLTRNREAAWLFTACKNTGEKQCFMSKKLSMFLNHYLPCIERIVVNNFNGLCFFSARRRYELPIYREMVSVLLQLKRLCRCEMTYYLHDYFTVCPYLFLVDDKTEYCHGGQDAGHCRRCMKNPHPWTFPAAADLDVAEWRKCSMAFLEACTKLVLFSLSAANLLEELLPGSISRHPEKLSLVKQDVKSSCCLPVEPSQREKMVIGVIGTIHAPKGVGQVLALRQYILDQGKDARIVVIGQLSTAAPVSAESLTVTGRYDRSDLPKLVRQHGVNVMFFSSIWPETYSRVISEIEAMELPVALYALGAPAERMRCYGKAMFIPDFSAESSYRTLEALFERFVRRGVDTTGSQCDMTTRR